MQQQYHCPICGVSIYLGQRFCKKCGMQLSQPTPQQQPPPPAQYQQPQSGGWAGYQQQASYGQEVMKPQKRGQSPWLIVSIILILLFIVGGIFVFARMNSGTLQQLTPTPPVVTPSEADSPGEVVVKFFSLMKQKNYSEAKKLIEPDSLRELESVLEDVPGGWAYFDEQQLNLDRVEIINEEITGDSASVNVITHYSDEPQTNDTVPLKRINGEWKILFE